MKKMSMRLKLTHVIVFTFLLSMMTTSFAQSRVVGLGRRVTPLQSSEIYQTNKEVAWQAAAVAICAAYFAGWVVGTVAHHAWDLVILTNDPELQRLVAINYNPNDFSSYDN